VPAPPTHTDEEWNRLLRQVRTAIGPVEDVMQPAVARRRDTGTGSDAP
jgi:hypothetical protein